MRETRLNKLDAGEYDAVVLAVAGLIRLGLEDRISARLDGKTMLPAVGQGALGLECRDDDAVTVGLGSRGKTFAPDALPDPDAFDWDAVGPIPTALVTGTNGKSTTVRMLAGMARAAGHTVGFSTTDAVTVGDEVVDRGDFSGPLGARAVMRDERVTLAVCESARGGLLRRGVPVPLVTAAALTNVAADHLGDYGVETVPALADAKLVVAKALGPGGVLVAPTDEPEATAAVRRQADVLAARGVAIRWTALDPTDAVAGPLAASVVDGAISLQTEPAT